MIIPAHRRRWLAAVIYFLVGACTVPLLSLRCPPLVALTAVIVVSGVISAIGVIGTTHLADSVILRLESWVFWSLGGIFGFGFVVGWW